MVWRSLIAGFLSYQKDTLLLLSSQENSAVSAIQPTTFDYNSAYNKRSDLVHGRKLEQKISILDPVNKEFKVHEFIELIKNYLSDSIKVFINLSNKKNHKQILNELHESSLLSSVSGRKI